MRNATPKLLLSVIAPAVIAVTAIDYLYGSIVLGEATYATNNLRILILTIILMAIFGLFLIMLSILSLRERPLPELPTTMEMRAAIKSPQIESAEQ